MQKPKVDHSIIPLVVREYKKIKYCLSEDNILITECLPNSSLELEDGIDCTKISAEMTNGIPLPLLCDLSNVSRMSVECRKHFSGEEHSKTFSKAALLISNPISRVIGNFFMGLNKPLKPTRLFTDKEKALQWLKQDQPTT